MISILVCFLVAFLEEREHLLLYVCKVFYKIIESLMS